MTPSRGFTLIEMIIGLGLGMVVIGTIYSGFRVASQSITISERMALENRMLVAGVLRAVDEVDTWNALDRQGWRPLGGTGPFKTISPVTGGYDTDAVDWAQLPQPFTPLRASWSTSGADGAYDSCWLPNDPRTWWRLDGGGLIRPDRDDAGDPLLATDSAYGSYAMLANAGATTRSARRGPEVAPVTRWQASQQKGLCYGLGFYGWLSYLPANAAVGWFDVDPARGNAGLLPWEMRDLPRDLPPNNGAHDWLMPTSLDETWSLGLAQGRMRVQHGTSSVRLVTGHERVGTRGTWLWSQQVAVAAPMPGDDAATAQRMARVNRQMPGSHRLHASTPEFSSSLPLLMATIDRKQPLVRAQPEHWPRVRVGVRRVLKWGAAINHCRIDVVEPLSGAMVEVSFPVIGTTLRGARMNRGLDTP